MKPQHQIHQSKPNLGDKTTTVKLVGSLAKCSVGPTCALNQKPANQHPIYPLARGTPGRTIVKVLLGPSSSPSTHPSPGVGLLSFWSRDPGSPTLTSYSLPHNLVAQGDEPGKKLENLLTLIPLPQISRARPAHTHTD